jgi:DnaJ-class molecular chaperone
MAKKKIDRQGNRRCGGYNKKDYEVCPECNGSGRSKMIFKECPVCGGYGEIRKVVQEKE